MGNWGCSVLQEGGGGARQNNRWQKVHKNQGALMGAGVGVMGGDPEFRSAMHVSSYDAKRHFFWVL